MKSRVPMAVAALLATGCTAPAFGPGAAAPGAPPAGAAAPTYGTLAQAVDPPAVVPVGATYHGKSYEDLSADWWNWAFNQPFDGHPMLDLTGEDAATGQNGDIWFLGGAFRGFGVEGIPDSGPIRITRHVDIPAGKALFFPILNTEADNSDCGGTSFEFSAEEALAFVTARQDAATGLSASIDGVVIPAIKDDFRVTTGPFTVIYGPTDETNLTSAICGGPGYRGTYRTAASSGYWLLVEPLSEGRHTICFTGTIPGTNPFTLDVTYELDVVGPGASDR